LRGAFRQRQHAVDHLRDDRLSIGQPVPANRDTPTRAQQRIVVVDLGHGAGRSSADVRRRLLLDRDCGRQAGRSGRRPDSASSQETGAHRRPRFDVAAAGFGIDGVEGRGDDFPEPDSPVKTTSLSRGNLDNRCFVSLCSRAPRMVIARVPASVCWRCALITSSIRQFARRGSAQSLRRCIFQENRDRTPMGASEHGKEGVSISVSRANNQRFVDHAAFKAKAGAMAADRPTVSVNQNKKDRASRPFLFNSFSAD